jgi:hypothetical protein
MNRHSLQLAFTSAVVIILTAPLAAQQSRSGARPAQEQGRGVTMRPAPGRGMIGTDESGPRPQAFSVSLVLGEMQATGGSDNVPPAARKALTDVKDFLPYKAYRLLDSQWTLCCGRSAITTRLRGPEEQDYALELTPSNAGGGKWYVHFSLWEPRTNQAATEASAASSPGLEAQRVALERQLAELRKTEAENHPDVAHTRVQIESLERALNDARRSDAARRTLMASIPRRALIDTSFTMEVGETVVVGTSRLKGDKALIALLTAVAPAKSTTK